jgi:hypothetical protein
MSITFNRLKAPKIISNLEKNLKSIFFFEQAKMRYIIKQRVLSAQGVPRHTKNITKY